MEFKEYSAKNVEEAITAACEDLGVTSDNLEYEVIEKGGSGFLGIGSKNAVIKAAKKVVSPQEKAEEFLSSVLDLMDVAYKLDIKLDETDVKTININILGDDMGVLIGKRGQTLDSLQYLVSLVVNKNAEDFYRIKLDTENYRERRQETLENLARNIAFKVKKTRRPVALEPMNPNERRIIHSALQNDKYCTTRSEGEEPYRHVVVVLKKK